MAELIIQVTTAGRHHSVLEKVEHFPFRIGRAYDNDLIIADDTVSPHHLEILQGEEGELLLKNLSVENGSYLDQRKMSDQILPLLLPNKVETGRTSLTLLSADSPIAATRAYVPGSRLTRWCSDFRVTLIVLIAYLWSLAGQALDTYSLWQSWNYVRAEYTIWVFLPLMMALIASFISRMLLHDWRIFLHLSIAGISFLSFRLLQSSSEFISYWLTSESVARVYYLIGITVLMVVFLTWQLRAVSAVSRRRVSLGAVAVVLPLVAIYQLSDFVQEEEFSSQPSMHTLLRESDIRLQPTEASVDVFRKQVEADLQVMLEQELGQ